MPVKVLVVVDEVFGGEASGRAAGTDLFRNSFHCNKIRISKSGGTAPPRGAGAANWVRSVTLPKLGSFRHAPEIGFVPSRSRNWVRSVAGRIGFDPSRGRLGSIRRGEHHPWSEGRAARSGLTWCVFEEYLSTTLAGLARHRRRSPLEPGCRAHWPYLNKIVESGSGYQRIRESFEWRIGNIHEPVARLPAWIGHCVRPSHSRPRNG